MIVTLNMAVTLDGKITSAQRERPAFTSRTDRARMDALRAQADAVLVGAATLRAEDPPLQVQSAVLRAERRAAGKPEGLVNVVLSRSGALSPTLRFFTDPLATARIIASITGAAEVANAEVWSLGEGSVDIEALLRKLEQRGIKRLLVEGGGEVAWSFLAINRVDEIYVTIVSAVLGGRAAPTMVDGEGFSMAQIQRFKLSSVENIDGELFCKYVR